MPTVYDFIFYFGKHNGEPVSQVPSDYLQWCLDHCTRLDPYLRESIVEELKIRTQNGPRDRYRNGYRHNDECDNEPSSTVESSPYSPGKNSTPAEPQWTQIVRQLHREMALKFHPDRGGSNEAMVAINTAIARLKELTGL